MATKPRVDGHEAQNIYHMQHGYGLADGRVRIEGKACAHACGLYLAEDRVQMRASLQMDRENIGSCGCKGGYVALGPHNHEVDIEHLGGVGTECLNDGHAEGEVGHKLAIHHIYMHPIGHAGL